MKISQDTPDIADTFQAFSQKNEAVEVLKELFDKDKLYMIGDLTSDEVKLITRIYMISKIKNLKVWESGINVFMTLLLSKNRKSRSEIIEAIKGYIDRQQSWNNLNPNNRQQMGRQ